MIANIKCVYIYMLKYGPNSMLAFKRIASIFTIGQSTPVEIASAPAEFCSVKEWADRWLEGLVNDSRS